MVLDFVRQRIDHGGCGDASSPWSFDAGTRGTDPGDKVLLATTGVGGVGLNLTCANHVLLLESPFKPASEAQTIERCQSIGQAGEVMVHKMVTLRAEKRTLIQRRNPRRPRGGRWYRSPGMR